MSDKVGRPPPRSPLSPTAGAPRPVTSPPRAAASAPSNTFEPSSPRATPLLPPPPPGGPGVVGGPGDDRDLALRRAIAQRLTKAGGAGTAEDAAAVAAELEKLPLTALRRLDQNHTHVVACRGSVTDYLTDLRGQAPRGWPPGATWDQVPGTFSSERNEVVIATTAASATDPTRIVPPQGMGHGAANLVAHETGHGLDYRSGNPSRQDPAFLTAYEADRAKLDAYLSQTGEAGHEEAFAESLAMFVADPRGSAAEYPHLMDYWAHHSPFDGGLP